MVIRGYEFLRFSALGRALGLGADLVGSFVCIIGDSVSTAALLSQGCRLKLHFVREISAAVLWLSGSPWFRAECNVLDSINE